MEDKLSVTFFLWDWFVLGKVLPHTNSTLLFSERILLGILRITSMNVLFYALGFLGIWKIPQPLRKPGDTIRELACTIIGLTLVSGLILVFAFWMTGHGWMKVYLDRDLYPFWYYVVSFPLAIFSLDTFFYFMHRLLHRGWAYDHIHHVHHRSIHTGPLSGTSFHPLEFLTFYSFPYVLALFLPLHIDVLNVISWMTFFFVTLSHSGMDPLPESFRLHRILSLWNSPTHHHLHHHIGKGNYSLFFNLWDRILKTNNPWK